jgi:hypothetical protein
MIRVSFERAFYCGLLALIFNAFFGNGRFSCIEAFIYQILVCLIWDFFLDFLDYGKRDW